MPAPMACLILKLAADAMFIPFAFLTKLAVIPLLPYSAFYSHEFVSFGASSRASHTFRTLSSSPYHRADAPSLFALNYFIFYVF